MDPTSSVACGDSFPRGEAFAESFYASRANGNKAFTLENAMACQGLTMKKERVAYEKKSQPHGER